mmetsp:Transcript_7733/g.25925  ORF Transcript_7733/g.25925 Transcript_7733/m.25925 type:complete len:117 (-) Transcript_7733:44-394(-)
MACSVGGAWERAVALLEDARAAGVPRDACMYNKAISACGRGGGGWERALVLFDEMRAEGLRPDLVTYEALISQCRRAGQLDHAERVGGERRLALRRWGAGELVAPTEPNDFGTSGG